MFCFWGVWWGGFMFEKIVRTVCAKLDKEASL